MKGTFAFVAMFSVLFFAASIFAADEKQISSRQQLRDVALVVEDFLKREASGLPGQVAIEAGKLDDRLALSPCRQMHAFFPVGSRAWGQTSVGVRCSAPNAWTIYLPARVRVTADYLEAARPLAAGQEISPTDIVVRHGDLDQLPSGVLTEPAQVIGRKLVGSVRAGAALRVDSLREVPAVQSGQLVALQVAGPGFRVHSEGRTLGKAAEGKLVQVRTASGSVVNGIVRPGPFVEIVR